MGTLIKKRAEKDGIFLKEEVTQGHLTPSLQRTGGEFCQADFWLPSAAHAVIISLSDQCRSTCQTDSLIWAAACSNINLIFMEPDPLCGGSHYCDE